MFGFLFGAVCLLGLVRVIKHGHGCGGHDGRGWHGHHHHGWHGHRHGGWRRHNPLYWLFERLDATPGQEKVILQAVEELRAQMGKVRGTVREQRSAFADAFRGETLSEEQASALFNPFAQHFDELRAAAAKAMGRIHDALDERQRRILSELLQGGWGGFGGGWRRHGGGCGHHSDPAAI